MKRKYRYKILAVMIAAGFTMMGGCGDEKDMSGHMEDTFLEDAMEEEIGNGKEEREEKALEDAMEEKAGMESKEEDQDAGSMVVWDDVTGEGIKTVEGEVRDIADGSFVISQIYTGTMENDELIAVMPLEGEEENLITVNYSNDVKVTVRISTDGMTSTERAGSIEELEEGSNVTLTGSWEGDCFRADTISVFILEFNG